MPKNPIQPRLILQESQHSLQTLGSSHDYVCIDKFNSTPFSCYKPGSKRAFWILRRVRFTLCLVPELQYMSFLFRLICFTLIY